MPLESTLSTLRTLVGFDTVSARSNRQLIDWVADRLQSLGASCVVQQGDEPGKVNLLATIGPAEAPGVMLSGHSDTVPVDGEVWSSDPFELTQRGGNLHGRGSADMKGFIACALEMAPRFAKARLKAPIHIALSYNEETNMRGMRLLVEHLQGLPVKPAACVIGEPTSMRVVVANKGAAIWRVRIKGKPVHSAYRHQGVSAVENAAEIVVHLNRLQAQLQAAQRHDGFEFPHTSVHVGRIHGGTAHNITAQDCEFLFEIRTLPGVRARDIAQKVREYCQSEVLPGMRAVAPEADIQIEEMLDAPGLDERGNRHLAQALMPLCGREGSHRVSFGTEAGMLQDAGIQTVILGPGSIEVAHRADEFVEIEQLEQCNRFLDTLAQRLSQAPWTTE
jgi:acetylornithine deacetylase